MVNKITKMQPWKVGFLDIHHINTGRGDATFFIFPDGTTMLLDAGDVDSKNKEHSYFPLQVAPPRPNKKISAGKAIVGYIDQVLPEILQRSIDYMVISHFHSDHMGYITTNSQYSKKGTYKLSGITEVGEYIPVNQIIDRGYPDYDFPVNIKEQKTNMQKTFLNYLQFIAHNEENNGTQVKKISVGCNDQIVLKHKKNRFKECNIQIIAGNGCVWNKKEGGFTQIIPKDTGEKYNENNMSIALLISFGPFRYYTGGDLTGLQDSESPEWVDLETPVSQAVGKVDAMVLNHHGNRDSTNANFLRKLAPRAIIQQAWCSDQPGQEVFHRLTSKKNCMGERDVFATYIHQQTRETYGVWTDKTYASIQGHVMIRVSQKGEKYFVYTLDDHNPILQIKQKHGPYFSWSTESLPVIHSEMMNKVH